MENVICFEAVSNYAQVKQFKKMIDFVREHRDYLFAFSGRVEKRYGARKRYENK